MVHLTGPTLRTLPLVVRGLRLRLGTTHLSVPLTLVLMEGQEEEEGEEEGQLGVLATASGVTGSISPARPILAWSESFSAFRMILLNRIRVSIFRTTMIFQ